MAGIFKAYDIRGVYGQTLTDDMAWRIGCAFAAWLKPRTVVVGRDCRPHSLPLMEALAAGLMRHGADVLDLGLCSTPMSYHANGVLGADASIMITASHNPAEWNGFKLCRAQAVPISGATGIAEIERIVESGRAEPPAPTPGTLRPVAIADRYREFVRSFAHLHRPLRIAMDFANAMGILEARALEGLFDTVRLYDTLDGSFPNHEANPLKTETLDALREAVRRERCDFGVAFDGDADRAGFVDERGEPVPMDMVTALIAAAMLERHPGATIFYDLRSSRAVREVIEERGGRPMMSRVGHAFIKQQMRDHNAVFAGELSGHYYFRDNFYTESSALAVLHVANLVSAADVPLSELIRPFRRYCASGEINSRVDDVEAVFERLERAYPGAKITRLDGLTIEFDDWWFNVRASNTEPLVRLNLEAATPEEMARRRDEVLAHIRG
ncbi:MAG: phosphomannomutase/phosphoglucomutase [Kiritimatiellae bacterium]|nr:phosphomannomutase/phosphoglucomutase [Kiritimatiellia bacterium]